MDAFGVLALGVAVRGHVGAITPSAAAFLVILFLSGLKFAPVRRPVNIGALDDFGGLARRVVVAYAAATAVSTFFSTGQPRLLLALAPAALALLFAGRVARHAIERAAARNGVLSRTLVVGTGETARLVIAALETDPHYGLEVVGAVGSATPLDRVRFGAPCLGNIDDISEIVSGRDITTIVVAFDGGSDNETLEHLRGALVSGADVWVVPRFFELGTEANATQHIGGIPVVRVRPSAQARELWPLKRGLDFVIAGAGVLFAAPLLALIAMAIKLTSTGPVLFRQERVGLGGRTFDMLKFRTMAPCSELRSKTEWAADCSRVTRVGRVLRETGLDELPQLFNVLKGDLTLVGPRPERPVFANIFDEMYPHYSARCRVPAGITGWAQIHGLRGDTPIDDRARFDNHYIENWSLAGDVKIILLTARTILRRYRGVTQSGEAPNEEWGKKTSDGTGKHESRGYQRAG